MHAPACGAFYASLLVASVTEIVWISHPWINHWHCCRLYYPQSKLFFAVETYLTLGLVAETSLALCWQRRAFWSSTSNWFDAIVCVASIASFMLYYVGGHTGLLDEALLLVVVGWLALRIARLAVSIRKLLRGACACVRVRACERACAAAAAACAAACAACVRACVRAQQQQQQQNRKPPRAARRAPRTPHV